MKNCNDIYCLFIVCCCGLTIRTIPRTMSLHVMMSCREMEPECWVLMQTIRFSTLLITTWSTIIIFLYYVVLANQWSKQTFIHLRWNFRKSWVVGGHLGWAAEVIIERNLPLVAPYEPHKNLPKHLSCNQTWNRPKADIAEDQPKLRTQGRAADRGPSGGSARVGPPSHEKCWD
jgi:hypothetical protein